MNQPQRPRAKDLVVSVAPLADDHDDWTLSISGRIRDSNSIHVLMALKFA